MDEIDSHNAMQILNNKVDSTQIAMEWISKSLDLENSINRIQIQKQNEQRKTRQSLNEYSLQISRLDIQNKRKESKILETEAEKENIRKLYEQEISFSSDLFHLNSNSKIGWSNGQKQGRNTRESIDEQNSQSSQQGDNGYLVDIIKELREQNIVLKNVISDLKNTLELVNWKQSQQECQEERGLDCISFLPTQNSVTYQRRSLASDIIQLGKKVSEVKDSGCFNYLTKESLVDRTITELEISSFNQQQQRNQKTKSSIAKNRKKGLDAKKEQEESGNNGVLGYLSRLLKRFVTERIKRC